MLFVAIFTFLLVTNGDPGHGIQAGSMVPWLKTADRWTIHRACTSFCLEIIWRIFGGRRVMVYIFTQVCEVVNNSSESVRCHSARVWNELPSSPPSKEMQGLRECATESASVYCQVRTLHGTHCASGRTRTIRGWSWRTFTARRQKTSESPSCRSTSARGYRPFVSVVHLSFLD